MLSVAAMLLISGGTVGPQVISKPKPTLADLLSASSDSLRLSADRLQVAVGELNNATK